MPMAALFRFRRFGTRLLVFVVGLLAATQLATYTLVSRANRTNALADIEENLAQGARQFQTIVERREIDLLLAARMMAGDYALRQLFIIEEFSPATARSALASYRERIQAPVIVMLDPAGRLLADTRLAASNPSLAPFEALRLQAEANNSFEASGWGYIDGTLYQLVMVPLLAPPPEVAAWIGIGFAIDETTARELKGNSGLEVTFLFDGPPRRVVASTLPLALASDLANLSAPSDIEAMPLVRLKDEDYVTAFRRLDPAGENPAWVVLQRSLAAELAPSRALERILLFVTLAGLAAAALAALALARSFSRPVQQLAAHTEMIAAGDYDTRIELNRIDELGRLAESFNTMSRGLAERDRVRDLLDKNVSPAVAARLLRDGAALGGEERIVTVLFADLRGFTTLSESLPAPEVVHLLNRYLDRMSHAIEQEGGVIDKFIGDEIMALFGAPIALEDAADRALRAALAMRAALIELNREFAAEGRPPLAFGIGINTASVVAGNIGSHRRLNYSVIGDGVNLAARLQSLTRRADYATDILVSDTTLQAARTRYITRDLGQAEVRGRAQAVRLHALEHVA